MKGMERLPQELIDNVVQFLERSPHWRDEHSPIHLHVFTRDSKLPPYATISKKWKAAVESITFEKLRIASNDLVGFQDTLTGNRRRYLSRLNFEVVLPEYAKSAFGRRESNEEQRANDDSFTRSITALFSILKEWEIDGLRNTLELKISGVSCPSDIDLRILMAEEECERQKAEGYHIDGLVEHEIREQQSVICKRRFSQSFVGLSEGYKLPNLLNVHCLRIDGNSGRALAPAAGPAIAASLSNLTDTEWLFCDDGRITKLDRVAFAHSLRRTRLQQGSRAEITFYHEPPEDQGRTPPPVIPAGMLYDSLSANLRGFSQTMTSFIVSGHLGPALFWPHGSEESTLPSWPCLRRLKVSFHMIAPSGEWYFTGTMPASESGDDLTDYDNYRVNGNTGVLNPFLTAFTQALRTMPVLNRFVLESQLGWGKGFFLISYYAPGPLAEWYGDEPDDHDDPSRRRLFYTVGDVWRPDEIISKGLRDVGRERHGEGLLERFCVGRWEFPTSD